MKTLKFMLAAATAIGIASVASAAQNVKASTGFEKLPLGKSLSEPINVLDNDDKISYFWYAGENPDDNESEIVAFTGDLPAKGRPTGVKNFTGADIGESRQALQVSTGTDPLLRTFNGATAQGGPVVDNTPLGEVTYVDTLVQFTVTPSTDTVTPGKDDKLMIYLKETAKTNQEGTPTGETATNLVVKAGYLGFDVDGVASVTPKEYKAGVSGVVPGKWYRLTVEAIPGIATEDGKNNGFIGFRVSLDGDVLTFDSMTYLDTDDGAAFDYLDENSEYQTPVDQMQILLSLQALNSQASNKKSLHAVGFAGEGLVDDLVVTTTDPSAKVVNFTLTAGDNVTAVSYTIGTQNYTLNNKVVYDVAENSTIEITSVEYAEGYEYDSYSSTGLTPISSFNGLTGSFTVTAKEAATLTINAKAKASSGVVPGGEAVVVDTREAAEALAVSVTSPDETVVSTTDYVKYFKTVITETADGKYSVTAELDETVVDPDATAADLAGKFDEISEAGEVTVVAKPGLYYSVKQGSSLGDMPEGARTMATGNTVNLKATKFPGAGFYQIMVNFTDKQ